MKSGCLPILCHLKRRYCLHLETHCRNIPQDCTVLNLSADFWSQAPAIPNRILEIVGNSLEDLAEARDRFRAYRQSGFEIEHFSREGKD